MMKRRCWFTIVLMVLLMLCLPITAVAQDRSPISQVSVTVTQEVTTGTANKPDVYANSEQYYIFDKPKFEKDTYLVGEEAYAEVTIMAGANYQFSGTSISVTGGSYDRTIYSDPDKIVFVLKTLPLKQKFDGPTDARWSVEHYGRAMWDEDPNASKYEVTYKGKTYETTRNYYNLKSKLDRDYEHFEVRSIPKDGEDNWVASDLRRSNAITWRGNDWDDDCYWDDDDYYYDHCDSDHWDHDDDWNDAYYGRWHYYLDGHYYPTRPAKNCWVYNYSNGYWYYTTGWSDDVVEGWRTINGAQYYFDRDTGCMRTGYFEQSGKKYFFNSDGSMVTNNWVYLGNHWYFFGGNGAAVTSNWIWWNGQWYYLHSDGKMAVNTWIGPYYVDSNGVWIH